MKMKRLFKQRRLTAYWQLDNTLFVQQSCCETIRTRLNGCSRLTNRRWIDAGGLKFKNRSTCSRTSRFKSSPDIKPNIELSTYSTMLRFPKLKPFTCESDTQVLLWAGELSLIIYDGALRQVDFLFIPNWPLNLKILSGRSWKQDQRMQEREQIESHESCDHLIQMIRNRFYLFYTRSFVYFPPART